MSDKISFTFSYDVHTFEDGSPAGVFRKRSQLDDCRTFICLGSSTSLNSISWCKVCVDSDISAHGNR